VSKGPGFEHIVPKNEEDNLIRYELDLLNSTNPTFKEYQRLAKRTTEETTA
jgi:hypothetical protein